MSPDKAAAVLERIPEVTVHEQAAALTLGTLPSTPKGAAEVAVLSGGSSDRRVVAEACLALRCHGVGVDPVMDVGVLACIVAWRRVIGLDGGVLNALHTCLNSARVLIACAGMEGALPTVLAGLVPQPVIAVPVSVGYGVSAGGRAALDGMLASCAPGLVVVNIDNGYGASHGGSENASIRSGRQAAVQLTEPPQFLAGMVTFHLLEGVHQGMQIGSGQFPVLLPFHCAGIRSQGPNRRCK